MTTEQESQNVEYLFDYVYLDSLRLSHYYSQLSGHGLVTASKKTSKQSGKQASGLQVKAFVAGANIGGEQASEESLELNIDSAFSRPQETLDALYDAGYIHNGITDARMGSLFLAEGAVSLFDIRLLRELWPFMSDTFAANETAHISDPKQKQKAALERKKHFDNIAQVIAKLPHSLQGTLSSGNDDAWFTLKPENMLVSPEDLSFKHGTDLKGTWHVLAIIDALPDDQSGIGSPSRAMSDMETAMRGILEGLKGLFGRPSTRYGITPLMIFRTIRKVV